VVEPGLFTGEARFVLLLSENPGEKKGGQLINANGSLENCVYTSLSSIQFSQLLSCEPQGKYSLLGEPGHRLDTLEVWAAINKLLSES